MLYFTKNKKDCTGCGACYASCPVKCITMQKDEEGFQYPVASDECIHCGKCEKVCPIVNIEDKKRQGYFKQKAYCALTKDEQVWARSASGGAFTEICKAFGDKETVICGAAWDGLTVHHICVEGVKNIAPLCKSKYIASSSENVILEIKEYLKQNKKVVFCGTPCQIAGLKNALGDKLSNKESIIFIDLICHGVGSPVVFNECIKEIGNQYGIEIKNYEFRAKRNAWETDHLAKVSYNNGGGSKYLTNDQYIQLFLQQNCLRPSCGENCQYRCVQRQGDITIADFKGLTKVFPNLIGNKKNYSSVIINTYKGDNIMKLVKKNMEVFECLIEDIKEYNPLFYRQTWYSKDRDKFFDDFKSNPSVAIKTWTSNAKTNSRSLKRKLYDVLPVFVRHIILEKKQVKNGKKK